MSPKGRAALQQRHQHAPHNHSCDEREFQLKAVWQAHEGIRKQLSGHLIAAPFRTSKDW